MLVDARRLTGLTQAAVAERLGRPSLAILVFRHKRLRALMSSKFCRVSWDWALFLTALWSANQGSKALFSALNVAYGQKERRSFSILTSASLAFTVGAVVFILLAIGAVVVLRLALQFIGLTQGADTLLRVIRWPAILVVNALFLACLYRFGPSRTKPQWRWVTWGSAFAAVAWIILSGGFSWYVEHFGSYNKTYGSLGAAVGFMTWIWLSTTVMLVGAQLNAEAEHQTGQDATVGDARPLGSRGATKADEKAQ